MAEQEKKCVYTFWDGVTLKAMHSWSMASAYFKPKDEADRIRQSYQDQIVVANSCFANNPTALYAQDIAASAIANSPFIAGSLLLPTSVPVTTVIAGASGTFNATSDLGSSSSPDLLTYAHAAGSFAAGAVPIALYGKYARTSARGSEGTKILTKEESQKLSNKLVAGGIAFNAATSFVLGGTQSYAIATEEERQQSQKTATPLQIFNFDEATRATITNLGFSLTTAGAARFSTEVAARLNGRAFSIQPPKEGAKISVGGLKGEALKELQFQNGNLHFEDNTTVPFVTSTTPLGKEIPHPVTLKIQRELKTQDAAFLSEDQKLSISALNEFSGLLTKENAIKFFGNESALPEVAAVLFPFDETLRSQAIIPDQHYVDYKTISLGLPKHGLPEKNINSFAHEYAHRIDHRNGKVEGAQEFITEALKPYASIDPQSIKSLTNAFSRIDTVSNLNSSALMSENYADSFYPAFLASLGETTKAHEAIVLTKQHRDNPKNSTFEYSASNQSLTIIERIINSNQHQKITNNDISDIVLVTSWDRLVAESHKPMYEGSPYYENIKAIREHSTDLQILQKIAAQAYERLNSKYVDIFKNLNIDPLVNNIQSAPQPSSQHSLDKPISQVDFQNKLSSFRQKKAVDEPTQMLAQTFSSKPLGL